MFSSCVRIEPYSCHENVHIHISMYVHIDTNTYTYMCTHKHTQKVHAHTQSNPHKHTHKIPKHTHTHHINTCISVLIDNQPWPLNHCVSYETSVPRCAFKPHNRFAAMLVFQAPMNYVASDPIF